MALKSAQKQASKQKPTMLRAAKSIVMDGWTNILTGLGGAFDKRISAAFSYERMADNDADSLYGSSDVAARIIDIEPEDAIRQWFTLSVEGDETMASKIDSKLDELKAATKLTEAWQWGRLHGGSGIYLNVDDSADPSTPLDYKKVRELKSLIILEKRELNPGEIDRDLSSTRFGEPINYRFNPTEGSADNSGQTIHHSRLILFYGAKLPPRLRQGANYWGDSVLNRCLEPIMNYSTANNAVATILQEFNQGVFKMKGLAEMLLAGHDEDVQKRLTTVQMSRSICRAVVIDSDSEEFANVGAHVQGIPEMLRTVDKRLVVASRMPHTKILGESPSGLGATGESEKTDWNDHISNQQEIILRPIIQRIIEVIFKSSKGPTSGKEPKWYFEFNPLKQPSETEIIQNRKVQSDIDKANIENGVVDPIEVRQSRFGAGKYSFETTIDRKFDDALSAGDNLDDQADPIIPSPDKNPEVIE